VTELFEHEVFLDIESAHRLVVNNVDSRVASVASPYQQIDIFRTPHFGLVLSLDGIIQVAESDEHIYHELLVHPACLLHGNVRSALVLGGGDGCASRELLKYRDVAPLDLVELDGAVVDLCGRHFREINGGALDDPRLEVIVQEAEAYLMDNPHKRYDVVVADLTEPYDTAGKAGKLSRHIFSRDFYDFLKRHLNPRGILVLQTGGITYIPEIDRHHRGIVEGIHSSFSVVGTAYEYIHSFDQIWSVTLASDYPYDIEGFLPDPVAVKKELSSLRYYDDISHKRAFQTPRHLRDLLAK
jgi:spermidine synthase